MSLWARRALPSRGGSRTALLTAILVAIVAIGALAAAGPGHAAAGVDTYRGHYFYRRVDLSVYIGPQQRIQFERSYSSGLTSSSSSFQPGLGPGWTHNFNMRVDDRPGSDVRVVGPQGYWMGFVRQPDGTYQPRVPGIGALTRDAENRYLVTDISGARWTFDTGGTLRRIQEPAGAPLVVTQGGGGVESVAAEGSRAKLLFDYDPATQRLVQVIEVPDPALGSAPPRLVQFRYDERGRLSEVRDREGIPARFAYRGDTPRLASIVDARGHVAVTVEYDETGRVARRTDARGERTGRWNTFHYSEQPDGTRIATERRVPSGYAPDWSPVLTFVHDRTGQAIRGETLAAPDDAPEVLTFPEPATGRLEWSLTGGRTPVPPGLPEPGEDRPAAGPYVRVGSEEDPLPTPFCGGPPMPSTRGDTGAGATGQADPRQQALRHLLPLLGQASEASVDPYGRLVALATPDRAWQLAYDREDRLLGVEATPVGAQGEPVVVTFSYDAVGNLVEYVAPDGSVARFAYDERDALVEAQWPSGAVARYAYDDRGDLARASFSPADGAEEQVVEYAFDGLHRPRWTIRFTPEGPQRTNYGYDDGGRCTLYREG